MIGHLIGEFAAGSLGLFPSLPKCCRGGLWLWLYLGGGIDIVEDSLWVASSKACWLEGSVSAPRCLRSGGTDTVEDILLLTDLFSSVLVCAGDNSFLGILVLAVLMSLDLS